MKLRFALCLIVFFSMGFWYVYPADLLSNLRDMLLCCAYMFLLCAYSFLILESE